MKRIVMIGVMAASLLAFSCNNDDLRSDEVKDQTDSLGTEAVPGNSPVMPNSPSSVMPDDRQTNSNGIDTAMVDTLTPPDTAHKQ